jgi:predicted NUDIX family phosphoesterase
MSDAQVERVLVVPTELFRQLGYFQGFNREVDRYLPGLLDPAQMSFRPRNEVERDPSFKQLIPYVILRHRGLAECVFQYTRGTGQGEGRLHRKRSVGIGGHISLADLGGRTDVNPSLADLGRTDVNPSLADLGRTDANPSLADLGRTDANPSLADLGRTDANPYVEGMRRELDEEVIIASGYTTQCVGLINDDQTEVGQVHLGLVHVFDLSAPCVCPREQDITECQFRPVAEILADLAGFETWSQICLQALFG